MGYLANFMVYTLAMIGIIAVALLVFKNSNSFSCGNKSKYLKVIDSLTIGPRKTLYIVSTGKENFLIAGDVDKTSLISKLESTKQEDILEKFEGVETPKQSFQATMEALPKRSYMDKSNIGIKSSLMSQSQETRPVMKSLVERIKV